MIDCLALDIHTFLLIRISFRDSIFVGIEFLLEPKSLRMEMKKFDNGLRAKQDEVKFVIYLLPQ